MVSKSLVLSAAAALALAAGSPAAAAAPSSSRATCMLLSDLVLMQYQMRKFHDMLKAGTDTGEARRLHHWLSDHPQVDLRIRLRRAGLQNFERSTLDLITRHKGLLEIHRRHGPGKAEAEAKRLGTDARLQSYSARILPLPCNYVPPEDSAGGALSGLGQLKRLPQEAVITGSLLTLILGAAAGVLAQRLARRRLRLSRRHPCALPCFLECGDHRFEARIVDISRLGAKVRVGLEDGQPVPLIKGDVTASVTGLPPIEAQTIRQDHDYVGIKFSSRLARAELKRLRKRNAAQTVEPQAAVSPA
ncbi:PilZ domain-containing protein [Leisingera aquaemixtae]|uniref:PilZ domain protein n=1 Tax=Leisingera aquaemixtae TaxID=1396826 RepID=A0A0N7M4Z6_9RHOB|nr:PilZ domain-containing protein [Leisingera aquaemixtae]CUI01018.1 PilZ domain protein [Leisingera aquaemixtae]